jgi:hypothetical protein
MSATLLAEAYERIVPPRIRILRSQMRRGDKGEQQAQQSARRRAA